MGRGAKGACLMLKYICYNQTTESVKKFLDDFKDWRT